MPTTAAATSSTKPMAIAFHRRRNFGRMVSRVITDDNLWRPTRRAEEHYTKDKLSTRRGAVHSIGWLFGGRAAVYPSSLSMTDRNSITSIGQSAQSCSQQMIKSQPEQSWP
jgi:hypothetical protein